MTRIILIGYMGAGKTTVGKALSQSLALPFYDLDWYIEERYRRTIPQIFAENGENGFREIEQKILHEVAEFENVIISWGNTLLFRQHGIHEPAGTNGIPESFSRRAVPASEDGKGGTSSVERQNGG